MLNSFLSLSQVRKHITDLYEDLRDGHNLISLLEVLSGVTLVWHTHTQRRTHIRTHMHITDRPLVSKMICVHDNVDFLHIHTTGIHSCIVSGHHSCLYKKKTTETKHSNITTDLYYLNTTFHTNCLPLLLCCSDRGDSCCCCCFLMMHWVKQSQCFPKTHYGAVWQNSRWAESTAG